MRSAYSPTNSDTIEHWKAPAVFSNPGKCTFFLGPHAKEHLVEIISRYSVVIGCVAWLTDFDILDALAKKSEVSIVVQKEDFLRPDRRTATSTPGYVRWKRNLQKKYKAINGADRDGVWALGNSSVRRRRINNVQDADPCAIRCVGNHNFKNFPAFARMHHKFAIFGTIGDVWDEYHEPERYAQFGVSLDAVWMGSMNWSKTDSVDGAVFIEDPKIAQLYYNEFLVVRSHSESLDWTSEWCQPEHDGHFGET